ncbi:potassium channel family protein [Candidatus Bipolaricaulota bacterium]|nr:potassium channel family protein [Candidatus Bipolaricaulota bacterium]
MSECEYEGCEEPALRDSEHCIFHEPNKSGLAAKGFYKLIRQEAREPEGENAEIDENNRLRHWEDFGSQEHRRWVFEKDINWKGYCFPSVPDDSTQPTDFRNKAEVMISFVLAEFKESVDFTDVKFEESKEFRWTKFKGRVFFDAAHFKNFVSFRDVDFFRDTSFVKTHFEGKVDWTGAKFLKGASFKRTQFEGDVWFIGVKFHRIVYMKNTEFGDGELIVGANKFENPRHGESFYRKVRKKFENDGNRDEADKWFRHEMIMKRRQLKSYNPRKWFSYLVDFITGYGTSWSKVIGSWIVVIFGYGLAYAYFNGLTATMESVNISKSLTWTLQPPFILCDWAGLLKNFYFSTVTFTTLGYGDIAPDGLVWQLVAGSESVIGGILMATLVLVFGRKFMR